MTTYMGQKDKCKTFAEHTQKLSLLQILSNQTSTICNWTEIYLSCYNLHTLIKISMDKGKFTSHNGTGFPKSLMRDNTLLSTVSVNFMHHKILGSDVFKK